MKDRSILILKGTIADKSSVQKEDLLITEGKIMDRGTINPDAFPDHEIINAEGKLVLPGGIDPHVHLALPTPAGLSSDDFVSGSRAAIAGGTTTFFDFVTPVRGRSMTEAFSARMKEAKASLLDYGFHLGISEWNSNIRSELISLFKNEKIFSVKTYLAYPESIGVKYPDLKEIMETVGDVNGLVLVHCEDGEMISQLKQELISAGKTSPKYHALSRPAKAEIVAVEKVIDLSAKTGCSVYIVHTSTARATELIHQAKTSGVKIYAETCPQYLLFEDSVYFNQPNDYKILPYIISPPIRTQTDQEALWKGLTDKTFDTVGTDHCPFNIKDQKDLGIGDFRRIPNGAGGIEHRLSLLYTYGVLTKKISLQQFVDLTSTRPAEIFGLGKRKGKLNLGFDADVVIWDPQKKSRISVDNHFQNCDSDLYEGFLLHGKPDTVIAGGKIAFQDGEFNIQGLQGQFINSRD